MIRATAGREERGTCINTQRGIVLFTASDGPTDRSTGRRQLSCWLHVTYPQNTAGEARRTVGCEQRGKYINTFAEITSPERIVPEPHSPSTFVVVFTNLFIYFLDFTPACYIHVHIYLELPRMAYNYFCVGDRNELWFCMYLYSTNRFLMAVLILEDIASELVLLILQVSYYLLLHVLFKIYVFIYIHFRTGVFPITT